MLELLVNIINLVGATIYYGFLVTVKTGQFFTNIFVVLLQNAMEIQATFITILKILLEDFYVFVSDISNGASNILCALTSGLMSVVNSIVTIVEALKTFLSVLLQACSIISNSIINGLYKIITGIVYISTNLKHFVTLVGSGIWFLITLLPLLIVSSFTLLTYYVGSVLQELINLISTSGKITKTFFGDLYNFVTDVPLESMAGLLAGACITYIIVKFQLFLYNQIASVIESWRLSWLRYRRRSIPQPEEEIMTNLEKDERVCVICQERNKCILILPCRHLCVCTVCNLKLRRYNATCPICRGTVQKTMKVFV